MIRLPLWLVLAAPAALMAHELDLKVRLAAPAVIVEGAYGGMEPLPFAKVAVFSPEDEKIEFQTGVTDREGRFAFIPPRGGQWRVQVDDEEGHRGQVTVNVPEKFEGAAAAVPEGGSRLERALLGVSILFGLTGFWYGFKARR
ncbi:MAG: hypothetical protein HY821_17355 [Acidobacteria bacterium]|nr:hypothetical protein [Acidobacteriota bacterium]